DVLNSFGGGAARLASPIRACARRGRAGRPPRAALGIPPRPHQAGRAASGHAAPRRLAWPTQSRNEHAGLLAPRNPAAHHGGVFHYASVAGYGNVSYFTLAVMGDPGVASSVTCKLGFEGSRR